MCEDCKKCIAKYAKYEAEQAQKAIKREKDQVCINPDSYIAKEIKYQTTLLHRILEELKKANAI